VQTKLKDNGRMWLWGFLTVIVMSQLYVVQELLAAFALRGPSATGGHKAREQTRRAALRSTLLPRLKGRIIWRPSRYPADHRKPEKCPCQSFA